MSHPVLAEVVRGTLFAVASPVFLASLVVLVAATYRSLPWSAAAAVAAAAAGMVPLLPAESMRIGTAALALVGAVAASGWTPGRTPGTTLAALAGASAGLAAELHWATLPEAAGGILALLLVGGAALALAQLLERRLATRGPARFTLRMTGAWITALALLILLLAQRR